MTRLNLTASLCHTSCPFTCLLLLLLLLKLHQQWWYSLLLAELIGLHACCSALNTFAGKLPASANARSVSVAVATVEECCFPQQWQHISTAGSGRAQGVCSPGCRPSGGLVRQRCVCVFGGGVCLCVQECVCVWRHVAVAS